MSSILSIETSTDVCSVALHAEKELLGEVVVREPQSHASRLAPMIEQVIGEAGWSIKDIHAIAIAEGPGSYTGLRIGASTAKGLCYALGVPLIAVGTLELLAFQASALNPEKALLCPMIDARRMEVYCMIADHNLKVIDAVSPRIVNEETFAELLQTNRVLFLGSGSQKCKEVIQHPNARFLDGIYPQASALGIMAGKKFSASEFEDLMNFKPLYLKEFVAKKAGGAI